MDYNALMDNRPGRIMELRTLRHFAALLSLLFCLAATASARAEWLDADGIYSYDPGSLAYDSTDDILAVYVLNYLSDGAEYWLYYRCNVELTWFSDPEPGRWDAVPDEERRVWGLFCAQRYQAPFKDF